MDWSVPPDPNDRLLESQEAESMIEHCDWEGQIGRYGGIVEWWRWTGVLFFNRKITMKFDKIAQIPQGPKARLLSSPLSIFTLMMWFHNRRQQDVET